MVYACCIPGCSTGRKQREDQSKVREKIPIFRLPKDEITRNKWLRAIPRKISANTSASIRVCAKHFYPEDLTSLSSDSHENRKAARPRGELKSQRVKLGTIPRTFPSFP